MNPTPRVTGEQDVAAKHLVAIVLATRIMLVRLQPYLNALCFGRGTCHCLLQKLAEGIPGGLAACHVHATASARIESRYLPELGPSNSRVKRHHACTAVPANI